MTTKASFLTGIARAGAVTLDAARTLAASNLAMPDASGIVELEVEAPASPRASVAAPPPLVERAEPEPRVGPPGDFPAARPTSAEVPTFAPESIELAPPVPNEELSAAGLSSGRADTLVASLEAHHDSQPVDEPPAPRVSSESQPGLESAQGRPERVPLPWERRREERAPRPLGRAPRVEFSPAPPRPGSRGVDTREAPEGRPRGWKVDAVPQDKRVPTAAPVLREPEAAGPHEPSVVAMREQPAPTSHRQPSLSHESPPRPPRVDELQMPTERPAVVAPGATASPSAGGLVVQHLEVRVVEAAEPAPPAPERPHRATAQTSQWPPLDRSYLSRI